MAGWCFPSFPVLCGWPCGTDYAANTTLLRVAVNSDSYNSPLNALCSAGDRTGGGPTGACPGAAAGASANPGADSYTRTGTRASPAANAGARPRLGVAAA